MNPIVRNIVAVIAGIIIGGIVNSGIIKISGSIIPPPEGQGCSVLNFSYMNLNNKFN
ncbi:MAG: hypothetical protein IPM42_02060 [Saprospiraceae bacterium]|nr:hypothetical protein [Saprospiraceae bacterium]